MEPRGFRRKATSRVWRLAPLALLLVAAAATATATATATAPEPYGRVTLQASASREVPTDSLRVVLFVEREGTDPRVLAGQVNRTIAEALEQAHRVPSVRVRSLDYRTWPVYAKGRIETWRVRQSIAVQSEATTTLAHLVGRLQDKLSIASVDYQLSARALERAENGLTTRALARFTTRAELVARSLGRSGYRIVRLDIRTGRGVPAPLVRAFAAARASQAPSFTSGQRLVRVTVAGTIELGPGRARTPHQ